MAKCNALAQQQRMSLNILYFFLLPYSTAIKNIKHNFQTKLCFPQKQV
jgi:hypothetical protein